MENESEWNEYRRALRDLPSTTEDPENPVWPERPKVEITNKIITKTQLEGELQTTRTDLQAEKEKTQQLEVRLSLLESTLASLIS